MSRDCLGTKALVTKLTDIMFRTIRRTLPQILEEINAKVAENEDRLRRMGIPLPSENKDKM